MKPARSTVPAEAVPSGAAFFVPTTFMEPKTMATYNSEFGGDDLQGTTGADVFVFDAVRDSTGNSPDSIRFTPGDKLDFTALETAIGHELHFAGMDPAQSAKAWGIWGW